MDPTKIDPDGQPCNPMLNRARREKRSADELLGLCKGILADGKLVLAEAEFLDKWIRANWERDDSWVIRRLKPRLEAMLVDGVLDQEEKAELFDLLQQYTGAIPTAPDEAFENYSTSLPLDDPPPPVEFPGRRFVLTGRFVTKNRDKCREIIESRGGECAKSVSRKVHYLVIGSLASRDWIHANYGRKIEKAIELRDKGHEIAIISEEHLARYAPELLAHD